MFVVPPSGRFSPLDQELIPCEDEILRNFLTNFDLFVAEAVDTFVVKQVICYCKCNFKCNFKDPLILADRFLFTKL